MPVFFASQEIIERLELIVAGARSELVLVTPVLQLSESLFIKLAEASERKVNITILCGIEPDPATIHLLSILKNIELFCAENMNARCYFNEEYAVLTSMALSEMNHDKCIDIALFIDIENDSELYHMTCNGIRSLIPSSVKLCLTHGSPDHTIDSVKIYRGFCICCGIPVTFNIKKPYCGMCRNNYKPGTITPAGNHCHSCGKNMHTTLSVPLCKDCSDQ